MTERDLAIVETARERRDRLAAAAVHGGLDVRRRVRPVHIRIVVGIVVGAIAVAVCAGVSFVGQYLHDRADAAATGAATVAWTAPGGNEEA
ncbi:hypothetical protein [Demequina sp. NBRC 110055]|uniref:hypothetical protein n=1 Tax=Demequina sp. NBRC 110055 TaxID=1570344 RepID=UPI0009FEE179|nr:hypothetical protein [Demequina sp. NBRC 110055]